MPTDLSRFKQIVIYIGAAFLSVAGFTVNADALFYMAGVLVAMPTVSYLVGLWSVRNLDFALECPSSGWEDETTQFTVVARSLAARPRSYMQARVDMPRWLVPCEQTPAGFVVPPTGEVRVPIQVELAKRGVHRVEAVVVRTRDPLGIHAFQRRFPVDAEILVYPVPVALPYSASGGTERYGAHDAQVATVRGSGVDPDGVRQYVEGDPLRHMHWRSIARTGKLNVIEFEEAQAANLVIAVDLLRGTDVGEGKDTTLEHLVRVAASLAQDAIRQGATVRLVADSPQSASERPGRGAEHLYTILAGLARVEAAAEEPLSTSLVARTGLLQPGTALVVLTAHADERLPGILAHYAATGIHARVVFADADSYRVGRPDDDRSGPTDWMGLLLAAGALPSVVFRDASGAVSMETYHYVPSVQRPD